MSFLSSLFLTTQLLFFILCQISFFHVFLFFEWISPLDPSSTNSGKKKKNLNELASIEEGSIERSGFFLLRFLQGGNFSFFSSPSLIFFSLSPCFNNSHHHHHCQQLLTPHEVEEVLGKYHTCDFQSFPLILTLISSKESRKERRGLSVECNFLIKTWFYICVGCFCFRPLVDMYVI